MTRLDTLPPEILFNILSYTEPICNLTLPSYPLNALAETNKQLNAVVEEYARNLLKRHADIVLPRNTRVFTCRRKWLAEICYFCKKLSKRKACLYKTLACCHKCDKAEFPKMTMTQATQQTHLSKLDLFTPSPLHPTLPPLPTGLYPVMGGVATMLSTPDVLARSTYIRSLLGDKAKEDADMRKRAAALKRITIHLNIEYRDFYSGSGWWEGPDLEDKNNPRLQEQRKKWPKSLLSEEERTKYAETGLKREWQALGVEPCKNLMSGVKRRKGRVGVGWKNKGGDSIESAIEIS